MILAGVQEGGFPGVEPRARPSHVARVVEPLARERFPVGGRKLDRLPLGSNLDLESSQAEMTHLGLKSEPPGEDQRDAPLHQHERRPVHNPRCPALAADVLRGSDLDRPRLIGQHRILVTETALQTKEATSE